MQSFPGGVSSHAARAPKVSINIIHPTTLSAGPRKSLAKFIVCAQQQEVGPPGAFEKGKEAQARQKLFNNISGVYDELNDKLSFGQHRVWKRMAVKWTEAQAGQRVLDVCCGSGDLAFLLSKAVGGRGEVVGLDFAQDMLDDAARREKRARAVYAANSAEIEWIQGDALNLPFPDASFDAATIGFGLRNVADVPRALRELHRVLRPGCRAAILDFNNSPNPVIDNVQQLFLERLVVPAAQEYGLGAEYEYLRPSIKAFPTGREQEALARAAGCESAVHYDVSFGLMGCLVIKKAAY